MLSSFISSKADTSALVKTKNVLLVDASVVSHQEYQQKQQRIHLCYSLNHNRMQQGKVTDKHTAEPLEHFLLRKNDLIFSDAGLGKRTIRELLRKGTKKTG